MLTVPDSMDRIQSPGRISHVTIINAHALRLYAISQTLKSELDYKSEAVIASDVTTLWQQSINVGIFSFYFIVENFKLRRCSTLTLRFFGRFLPRDVMTLSALDSLIANILNKIFLLATGL